jgi:hypothetical protein
MAGYDSHLRFRCSREDKAKLIKIAQQLRRKPSDLARIIIEDYVTAQEKALGIPPLTPPEIEALVEADDPKPTNKSSVKKTPSRSPRRSENRN